MAVTAMAVAAIGVVGAGQAFANAPNPAPTTAGTATLHADGTVGVVLSGSWTWKGQSCSGRYAEGWAVDWWGISAATTPAPSFSLTGATEVTAVGTTSTGTASPSGSLKIKGSGGTPDSYFHVAQYLAGETVNSSATCTDTGSGGSATSSGTWSAAATYPTAADMPAQLCVNLYDEHGSEGKPSNSAGDLSPTNGDNSIQTNTFDPAAGAGYCVALKLATGSIAGHIYNCAGGAQTVTEVLGGTLGAAGPQSVGTTANALAPSSVLAGGYTMTATAPSGYQMVSCGGSATVTSASSATEPVTVPGGGTGTGIFYVSALAAPVQTLAGHIYNCTGGTPTTSEVGGGTLNATGPQSLSGTNPLGPSHVASGAYSMTATAPSGYQMVACGGSATVNSASSATESVNVPSGGAGTGIFYVSAVPAATQTLAGAIYDCTGGAPTNTLIPGGTLSATGPVGLAAAANPLATTQVPSGTYTMTASAPAGYLMVTCGTSVTVSPSGSSASEPLAVPAGGSNTGIFYASAIPAPNTQTLAAHIFDCTTGAPTNAEVTGGTVSATGPSTVSAQANPLAPAGVSAGSYTVYATAPTGYSVVVCGGTATQTSTTTATEPVTVPAGGRGAAIFYVSRNPAPATQTIAGHLFDCSGGTQTTSELSGGTLSATGPVNLAGQGNPIDPTEVPVGTYTMVASPPPGYQLVTCDGPATVTSAGSANEALVLASNSRTVGVFYAALIMPATAPSTPTTPTPPTAPATKAVSGGALAFTGVGGLMKIVGLGALLMLAGLGLVLVTRRRLDQSAAVIGGTSMTRARWLGTRRWGHRGR
ncbi:MAG TPA: hypothetical protein VMV14_05505 [Acidimicrobiales bacterium]|nr:hypothetical protein [Acidimicrobiales bacterium]